MKRFLLVAFALSIFPALANAGAPKTVPAKIADQLRRQNPGLKAYAKDMKPTFTNGTHGFFTGTAYRPGPNGMGLEPTVENVSGQVQKGSESSLSISHVKIVPAKIQPR